MKISGGATSFVMISLCCFSSCKRKERGEKAQTNSIAQLERMFGKVLGPLQEFEWELVRRLLQNPAFLSATRTAEFQGALFLDFRSFQGPEKLAALRDLLEAQKSTAVRVGWVSNLEVQVEGLKAPVQRAVVDHALVGLNAEGTALVVRGASGELAEWQLLDLAALKVRGSETRQVGNGIVPDAIYNGRDPRGEVFNAVHSNSHVQIVSFLGRGGFGQVYEGMFNGKRVAFKIVDTQAVGKTSADNIILQHQKMIKFCDSHPEVCSRAFHRLQLSDFFTEAQSGNVPAVVVSELAEADGTLLYSALNLQNNSNSPQMCIVALEQLYDNMVGGVTSLAELGEISHNDIKPGNLLLTSEGNVTIADYDSLKGIDVSAGIRTPEFAAPEINSKNKTSATSDRYSVGLTLAGFLLGHNVLDLFYAANPHATADREKLIGALSGNENNHKMLTDLISAKFKELESKIPDGQKQRYTKLTSNIMLLLSFKPEQRKLAEVNVNSGRAALQLLVKNATQKAKAVGH